MTNTLMQKNIVALILSALSKTAPLVQRIFCDFDADRHEIICTMPESVRGLFVLHGELCSDGDLVEDQIENTDPQSDIFQALAQQVMLTKRQIDVVETLLMCMLVEMFPQLNNYTQVVTLRNWHIAGVIEKKTRSKTKKPEFQRQLN